MDCERFASHLGSLDDFAAADRLPDLDSYSSPLKFENSYNGHSFVVRMAHDQSFVSRIDLSPDIVRDCPEPQNRGSGVASQTDDIRIINAVSMTETNSTDKCVPAFLIYQMRLLCQRRREPVDSSQFLCTLPPRLSL